MKKWIVRIIFAPVILPMMAVGYLALGFTRATAWVIQTAFPD